jgi:hypothetical protein
LLKIRGDLDRRLEAGRHSEPLAAARNFVHADIAAAASSVAARYQSIHHGPRLLIPSSHIEIPPYRSAIVSVRPESNGSSIGIVCEVCASAMSRSE